MEYAYNLAHLRAKYFEEGIGHWNVALKYWYVHVMPLV
jgi:hypothetical protein